MKTIENKMERSPKVSRKRPDSPFDKVKPGFITNLIETSEKILGNLSETRKEEEIPIPSVQSKGPTPEITRENSPAYSKEAESEKEDRENTTLIELNEEVRALLGKQQKDVKLNVDDVEAKDECKKLKSEISICKGKIDKSCQ